MYFNRKDTAWSMNGLRLMIVLLVAALIVPVIPASVFAADTALVDDNFSSYAPGAFTIGSGNTWTKEGGTPDITVVNDTAAGRSYGSITNNTTGSVYVGQRFTPQSGGLMLEFDVNIPGSKGATLWVMDGKVNATNAAALRYQLDAGVIKRGNSSTANIINYNTAHWYRFNVLFNIPKNTYTMKITDLTTNETVNWEESFYSSRSKISSFGFYVNPGGGTINLTNVRVTSLDLALSNLQLAAEGFTPELNPAFTPSINTYQIDVPYSMNSISVIPTASNTGNVKVTVGDTDVASGMPATVEISEPSTSIAVKVTSETYPNISQTYTINVTKMEKSPDLKYVSSLPGDSKVKLGWEETVDPAYVAAHIYKVNGDQSLTLVDTVPKGTYISTVSGLTNGTPYTFVVKALYKDDTESSGVTVSETPVKLAPRQMEYLNRGLVAMKKADSVYVSWRLLGTDPDNIAFNLYRDGVKVNDEPIVGSTNVEDPSGSRSSTYYIKPVVNGEERQQSETATVWDMDYLSIPLRKPADGVAADGTPYSYRANDATAADLDGDGQYEIILKWDPSNSKDNSQSGHTGKTLVDAYKMDGTFLWRIDLGPNIRAGAHYLDIMAYDLDGDGKAEVTFRTADGTIDGEGNVIGDPDAFYANSGGYILTGPEYHTVFEGATGKALATENYEPERGNVGDWGDTYGNRVDRFGAAIAYLDGVHPSLIMQRGYYTRMVLVAYNWRDGQLTKVWTFDTKTPGNEAYAGQGNHQLSVADVDGDGKDEIITGAAAIDDNGQGLWSSGLGHGDAMHVSDLDPTRLGLEEWAVQENTAAEYSADMKDAKTGRVIWGQKQIGLDVGRGLSADIDPAHIGEEVWSIDGEWNSTTGGLFTAQGEKISSQIPSSNFAIWWDGDLSRELLDHNFVTTPERQGVPKIDKWDAQHNQLVNLVTFDGTLSNNDTKGNPALQADLLGDWREEVVVRNEDSTALRLYMSTDLTDHRFVTLMHDPVYRLGIAWQNTGYNQPPHLSYYLGNGMEQPERPNIYLAGEPEEIDVTAPVLTGLPERLMKETDTLEVGVTATDEESGIASLSLTFDGNQVENGQQIVLTGLKGEHTFTASATNRAGLTTNQAVVIRVIGADEVISTLTGAGSVLAGQPLDLTYGLAGVSEPIYAQDLTITYDPELLTFKQAVSVKEGFQVVAATETTPGSVRIIAAATGAGTATGGSLLKLSFTAKELTKEAAATVTVASSTAAGSAGDEFPVTGTAADVTIKLAVDKAALHALIEDAMELHHDAVVGTKPGQYPAAAKAALQAAIDVAAAVRDNAEATDEQVSQAVTGLTAAIAAFNSSIITQQPGDTTGDGAFTIGDLGIVAAAYGKTSADADWAKVQNCDMNNDGKIDIADLAAVAKSILG